MFTGTTPFFVNYNLHPCFNISLPYDSVNCYVEDWAHLLDDVHRDLSLELSLAGELPLLENATRCKQANHLRLYTPQFEVDDFVWRLRHNIVTTRPCTKLDYIVFMSHRKTWFYGLDYKKLSHFQVIQKIGSMIVHLELPTHFLLIISFMSLFLNLIIYQKFVVGTLPLHHRSSSRPKKNMRLIKFFTFISFVISFNTLSFRKSNQGNVFKGTDHEGKIMSYK